MIKKNIHMNRIKGNIVTQITVDDDYNVQDNKPDVSKIIQSKGEIKLEETQVWDNHVSIKGRLLFDVLFSVNEESQNVNSLRGEIPFEETINVDGAEQGDYVTVRNQLDDLSISMINSRKLSVNAIVSLQAIIEELYDEEVAVDLDDLDEVEVKKERLECLQMVVSQKDTYRIREDIVLPSNKPNIQEIIWKNIQLRGLEVRLGEGQLFIKGEVLTFVLYRAEEEDSPLQWLETAVPFHGEIECMGCNEDMVPMIQTWILSQELEAKPDYDGEERILQLEIVLEMIIKVYQEEGFDMIADLYALDREIIPIKTDSTFESLLIKNQSKCRTSERMKMEESEAKILQICHSTGTVKVDEINQVEDGISVEGIVQVEILYVSNDDQNPFNSHSGTVFFQHTIEAPNINKDCIHRLTADLEQLTTTMIDSDQIEVKATINLNTVVMQKNKTPIISQVEQEPLNFEKLQELPSITAYIPRDSDDLWNLAKQNYTTIAQVRETNHLKGNEIPKGSPILIIKTVNQMPG